MPSRHSPVGRERQKLAVLCRTPVRKEEGLFPVGDGSFAVETGPTCFANIRFL